MNLTEFKMAADTLSALRLKGARELIAAIKDCPGMSEAFYLNDARLSEMTQTALNRLKGRLIDLGVVTRDTTARQDKLYVDTDRVEAITLAAKLLAKRFDRNKRTK